MFQQLICNNHVNILSTGYFIVCARDGSCSGSMSSVHKLSSFILFTQDFHLRGQAFYIVRTNLYLVCTTWIFRSNDLFHTRNDLFLTKLTNCCVFQSIDLVGRSPISKCCAQVILCTQDLCCNTIENCSVSNKQNGGFAYNSHGFVKV